MQPADTKTPRDPRDWHPADVQAALKKAGWSLRRLSAARGNSPGWLQHVFRKPYPHAERVIAEATGIPAHVMWPSRYTHDGKPAGRGEVAKRQGPRSRKAAAANAANAVMPHAADCAAMQALAKVKPQGGA